MPNLIATKEVRYAGKTMLAGESFEASDKDAKVLVAIKKAEYGGAAKNKTDLPKKAAKIEEAPVEPEAPLSRTYHRRDMQAQDTQTGEDSLSSSSRRGRRQKPWGSGISEIDGES